jgi:hypothetical protein
VTEGTERATSAVLQRRTFMAMVVGLAAMILDERLTSFVEWCARYQIAIAAYLEAGLLTPTDSVVVETARAPIPGGTATPVPEAITLLLDSARHAMALHRKTKPELAHLRGRMQEFATELAATPGLAGFVAELRARVLELPEQLDLHTQTARLDRPRGKTAIVTVPLRRWLDVALVQPVTDILDRLDLDANGAVTSALAELDRLDKVTDYYALAVQRHSPELGDGHRVGEFAAAGLERSRALLTSYHAARRRDATHLRAQCMRQVSSIIETALAPLRSHRATELNRQLRVLEQRAAARLRPPSSTQRVAHAIRSVWKTARPWLHELRLDVRRTLADHELDAVEERWSEILRGPAHGHGQAALPVGYARLFTALPFELADVYQERGDLERRCFGAIEAWLAGDPRSIVVDGDRGSGKRTLLNQVLSGIRRRADVNWLRLGHALCDEPTIAEAVARELELPSTPRTFEGLTAALREHPRRVIIVVENSERVFLRTPAGVARARAFLEVVARTASRTLWVLFMATPAAELLDTVLELDRRVTDRIRVRTLDPETTCALILARHELSGHDLEFDRPHPRPLERVRRPVATARALADPREAYFARLAELAHGNPRQALYYWRSSLQLAAAGQRILVRPLPTPHRRLLEHVALQQRILLGLLVQHGSLAIDELASITHEPTGTTESDLHVLRARGLVVLRDEHQWALGPVVAHPLTLELRANNLI